MRKLVTEFLGTFFLSTVVLLTSASQSNLVPIAIGATLMVFVYSGGHISGGHYNPAVSLAAWVRGRLGTIDFIFYIAAQFFAALLAFIIAPQMGFTPKESALMLTPKVILIAEGLFTFMLCYTVLNVATARNTSGNSYFGLAIGSAVLVAAIVIGPVTSAILNPAVLVSLSMGGFLPWNVFVIYLIAQALGGIVAGVIFKFSNPLD